MAHSNDDKNRLIEILSENPLINFACKKVGISRNAFYRWMRCNPEFKQRVEAALRSGRSQWGEMAEASLIKNVKNGNMNAIKYYLSHNDSKYRPKRPVFEELLPSSEIIEYSRYKRHKVIMDQKRAEILQAMKNLNLIDGEEK